MSIHPIKSEKPLATMKQTAEQICHEWIAWKRAEELARDKRLAVELALLGAFDFKKLEGSTTFKAGDENQYKVSLSAKLDRKLDEAAYLTIADQIPEDMRPIKTKIELDVRGVKWLEDNQPEIASLMATCITTKPAKTAVKVEFLGVV